MKGTVNRMEVILPMIRFLDRSSLGAHVPHRKNTRESSTAVMPVPQKIVLMMSQHIGAPANPVVSKGDKVYVGTLVGEAQGAVSANIHSGVSGTVAEITEMIASNGSMQKAVVITPDGEQTVDPSIQPPKVTDFNSFIEAVRQSGLVGLGGAGFPAAVKLSPKNLDGVDTLLINGAECEPYITSDHREFMERSGDILDGIKAVMKYLNLKQAIIGIEKNKPEAIALMRQKIDTPSITVKVLPSRYPQGAEKTLVESCTKKEVPKGGLPADVGVIVMNVTSVSFLSRYLKTGMPLTKKRLTVDGDIVKEPKNVEVIVGTPFSELIDFCGGLTSEPVKAVQGGPMMGVCLFDLSYPVLKLNNALLVFGEKLGHLPKPSPCIRCGRCINGCPMGLSPVEIASAYQRENKEELAALQIDLCMECGTCTFVCPAKRPVTQTMKLAKEYMKKGGNA